MSFLISSISYLPSLISYLSSPISYLSSLISYLPFLTSMQVGLADFHLEKVLGKGSYGTVFKVLSPFFSLLAST